MKGKIANLLQDSKNDPDNFNDEEPVNFKVKKQTAKIPQSKMAEKQFVVPDIASQVNKLYNNEIEQRNLTIDLTSKLYYIMKDKTLEQNKTQEDKQIEINLINQYKELARVINSSDKSEDSQGTLVFVLALARSILFLRNRINDLEYENKLLQDQLLQIRLTNSNNEQ